MKALSLIALLVFGISALADEESRGIAQMNVCGSLERSLIDNYLIAKKRLPKSWDDFEEIALSKKGSLQLDAFRIKTINSFALVPGCPVIQTQPGIPSDYRGRRLFLISRQEVVTKSSQRGRCAILIEPEGIDSNPSRTYSYFISEEAAQLILKQISRFDPEKQPLAFDEQFILRNKNRIKGNALDQTIKRLERSRPSVHSEADSASISTSSESRMFWIIGAILLFLLCGFYSLVRRSRRNA